MRVYVRAYILNASLCLRDSKYFLLLHRKENITENTPNSRGFFLKFYLKTGETCPQETKRRCIPEHLIKNCHGMLHVSFTKTLKKEKFENNKDCPL